MKLLTQESKEAIQQQGKSHERKMEESHTNKRILYGGLLILFLILIAGIIFINTTKKQFQEETYIQPSPEEVVRQYFTAWSNEDYPNMYATISDGFKKIDPNAKNLAAFRSFGESQEIESVNIHSIKETSNDGTTASVEYSIEFTLADGSKRPFSDTFTLKFRQGDVIPGWKFIHPYGPNIDTS